MATVSYTVHILFAAPGLTGSFEWHNSLSRREYVQMSGFNGTLSAVVVVRSADGAGEAGLRATAVVEREWRAHGAGGPLQRLSWRAERERVAAGLFGRRRKGGGSREIRWDAAGGPDDDRPDDGGTAGVREPRRPKPAPPSMGMALPLDQRRPGVR